MSISTTVRLTVRYFAAARAAAGSETEELTVASGTTLAALVDQLSARSDDLARVLKRCSFLVDGVAARNRDEALQTNQTVDVLPPFAGG
jgi:molybdopterin synthase sulfur carrier subunit